MKFKKLSCLILCLLLLINLSSCGKVSFSSQNVYNTIKRLSSKEYGGRLAGTEGNKKAEKYIENYFKNIKLKPAYGNSYYQSFPVIVPYVNGECTLKVYDLSGDLVKEYIYGKDFKEMVYGASAKGSVKSNASFVNMLNMKPNNISAPILLVQNMGIEESDECYKRDIYLKSSGVKALIFCNNYPDFRFRSPYKIQKKYDDGPIKMTVDSKTFSDLKSYSEKGYSVEVKSPVEIKSVKAENVAGILPGKNKALPPLVLSAHFDHVGCDADNVLYPGALDNASGISFLLECARVIKASGIDRTVVFAAFNAEEEGLVGSKYFAEHLPIDLSGAKCINFDMVGTSKQMPLTLLSSVFSSNFVSEIKNAVSYRDIKINVKIESNSDHASLSDKGLDAVTFIHDDERRIHTPKDTVDFISKESIDTVYKALSLYISSISNKTHPIEVNDVFSLLPASNIYIHRKMFGYAN